MPPCKLCELHRGFIKAHAIPEAFFRELRIEGMAPLLVSGKVGQFTKNAPIGIYDEAILCKFCEPTFGTIDDFGIDSLLKSFNANFRPLARGGNVAGFESSTVDPLRLLQFLVTVLWRASVSMHQFYSKVDLGPYEPIARAAVSTPAKEMPEVFDAVLSRWIDQDDSIPTSGILDPARDKWFGVNAYRLYLGETVAYVKVDARPFPDTLKAISLRSAPPVLVVAREMAASKDLQAMWRTVHRSHQNKLAFRKRGSG